jgi:hypothetical protein
LGLRRRIDHHAIFSELCIFELSSISKIRKIFRKNSYLCIKRAK